MKKNILHIFYVSLFAGLIFGFRYLPFQDYPVLIYQGFVFNQVVFHGFSFGGFFHFHPYLPPNAISTIIMGLMDLVSDPFITGKIYLFLLAIALYSGFFRYLAYHLNQKRIAFAAVAFFLTINVHFLMGYINFLTGLAIVLHTIVFIRERKYETRYIPMILAFLIIYLCHFAAFALFSLYFFVYFISKRNYSGLVNLIISAVPALGFFLQYLFSRSIPILPLQEKYENIIVLVHWKLLVLFNPLIPFVVFKWVQEMPLLFRIVDYVFAVITLSLFFYTLGYDIFKHKYSFELYLATLSFLIVIILPLDFGGVTPAGERVVVFCAINTFVVIYRKNISKRLRRIALFTSIGLGAASYSYIIWNTAMFNSMIQRNQIPEEATARPDTKLEGTNGFLHLHFYDDILQKRPYPFFDIGLFEYQGSK